ncbi:MAG: bifunctional oligoribonuclease/PAP phosphatase NrnA [Anaerocolumna aminovalerica]|uniref:DHH family phosphoesterase n=1 Tax=Anaerocolumna aminovalerica TaxID=1527 RepID=UPI00248A9589|nr:bifunctional oligoribonuclease/PAP phosphatase NrnA [Anaerocolumna aminovalerica]MDU6263800.1 bifunctional oligoribonuclease/PAP phosphatase NrnA [Anaerocolumna aminovalerica]
MEKILERLKDAKTIGIVGHVRPDGDCIGSCMALSLYLKHNLPEDRIIDVFLEPIPNKFLLWKEAALVKQTNDSHIIYDYFIALDAGSKDRLGFAEVYFNEAKTKINIDHHISNTGFGDINLIVDNASSTCEVLFNLFDEDKIDLEVAKALYLGLIHDTGVFKHSNTREKTMNIAGKLIAKGVPFSKMIDETFYQKDYLQNRILGKCLLESKLFLDGKCIVSSLEKDTLSSYGVSPADLDGIIDQLRITKGVEVAVFLYETGHQEFKVSLRANGDVNVSKIAVLFGGGGHVKAAGCTMEGSVSDIISHLTNLIEEQLIK